jgi:hypothetical protein
MPKISINEGIYSDQNADYRTRWPLNYYPVAKQTGSNEGYLYPTPGITAVATPTGAGESRGAQWNSRFNQHLRVTGNNLIRVESDGSSTVLGTIPGKGRVAMAHSFNSQVVVTNTRAYRYDGSTVAQITDPDLGVVYDCAWVDGFYVFTDGDAIVLSDLTNETAIDPLRFGSSEVFPDRINGIGIVQNEIVAFNRYTTEVFNNVGGTGFPFRRVETGMVPIGLVGTHAKVTYKGGYAFLGGGLNENISLWLYTGTAQKLASRELEVVLADYTEAQLAVSTMDSYSDGVNDFLLINLPDRQIVYDVEMSKVLGIEAYHERTPNALHPVHAYGQWWVSNDDGLLGRYDHTVGTEWGEKIERRFETRLIWGETQDFIVHRLELQGTYGRAPAGRNPAIAVSKTTNGLLYSRERWLNTGSRSEYDGRFVMRRLGKTRQSDAYRFRMFNDSRISINRLDMTLEPING